MSRDIAPFGLRMPSVLKERLEQKARDNKRSLNAEITSTLEDALNDHESDNLFLSANDAKKASDLAKAKIKERILTKTFEDIRDGINAGFDKIFVSLDEFRLGEMNDEDFDIYLSLTFDKLKELGYTYEIFDTSCIIVQFERD